MRLLHSPVPLISAPFTRVSLDSLFLSCVLSSPLSLSWQMKVVDRCCKSTAAPGYDLFSLNRTAVYCPSLFSFSFFFFGRRCKRQETREIRCGGNGRDLTEAKRGKGVWYLCYKSSWFPGHHLFISCWTWGNRAREKRGDTVEEKRDVKDDESRHAEADDTIRK